MPEALDMVSPLLGTVKLELAELTPDWNVILPFPVLFTAKLTPDGKVTFPVQFLFTPH